MGSAYDMKKKKKVLVYPCVCPHGYLLSNMILLKWVYLVNICMVTALKPKAPEEGKRNRKRNHYPT
jgi:hypothetical protein